ncbi:MAG: NAD-dependent epimerase/dehydratase family protein, partial [Opitutales bacterium]|nr:NAD-dependent epimerase/dehydratase family protein [Opitutales bacterium]
MHDISQGKILVTGGSGLIGSAIIARLNELGHANILVTDKLGSDLRYKNLVPLKFAEYMEYEDFDRALESDPAQFADIKTIFHLGACSATTEKDCTYLIHNNYEYTKKLAAFALANGARFVYASSAATYGNGENGMDDEGDILPLKPLNMYGYS